MADPNYPVPRATLDLIGHRAAEETFLAAWSSGRVPHAWLITGPKGIGKACLAFRIARFVLADGGNGAGGLFGESPAGLALPGDHPVVRRVASGGHADLKVLERAWSDDRMIKRKSEIAVEDVRDAGTFLSLTPSEGGWRVVIVDSSDEMSRSAANAILKVLEEPPRDALLLLVSHNPGRLLPTIRSRCRRLALHPLSEPEIEDAVRRTCPDLPSGDVAQAAAMARGSIGQALDLCAHGGMDLYREMERHLLALPRLDIPALHAFAERTGASDGTFAMAADMLTWWLAKAAGDYARRGRSGSKAMEGGGAGLVGLAGLDRWLEVWDKTVYLFERSEAVNLDRKQVMLNAFFALERACRP